MASNLIGFIMKRGPYQKSHKTINSRVHKTKTREKGTASTLVTYFRALLQISMLMLEGNNVSPWDNQGRVENMQKAKDNIFSYY